MSPLALLIPEDLGNPMDILTDDPAYSTFLHRYLLPNRPVLIRSRTVLGWPAITRWTAPAGQEEPSAAGDRRADLPGLAQTYGHLEVPVVKQTIRSACPDHQPGAQACRCSLDWGRRISGQVDASMTFSQVAAHWEQKLRCLDRVDQQEGPATLEDEVIYVKDWHLIRMHSLQQDDHEAETRREGQKPAPFYRVPEIFMDDWMNDYYSAETDDDFRFVYMGERGTTTGLHTDVYNSYSWSANIVGKKRWRLFSPESAESITVEQSPGEIIFVPSGWRHEVLNISPLVISINHNWCNSVNLPSVYDALAKDIEDVKRSIADVKDLLRNKWAAQLPDSSAGPGNPAGAGWELEWIEVVQELTKQHSGWNWTTFWGMVQFITRRDFNEGSTSPLSDQPVPTHSPPLEFVKAQISSCVAKFKTRDEFMLDTKLGLIIQDIESCLSMLR
ncbi:hypothetical protein PTTG_00601 [Puccinia triticina 1-1 BBBD Race 1]|uniref:JmjC domain-containing protein n=1 Tax=Puccinia triticina (isolate 1-1 / race 1 (BBBD)) TaxID=630390 RepID=A0A180G5Q7_PUCT1|nr:hypothetical protein PTTG_00601 [Puccinia triticina 1-1 BBBD Race 1]